MTTSPNELHPSIGSTQFPPPGLTVKGDPVEPDRREQLMLDQLVQGVLIRRVVLHWLLCLLSTGLAAWVWAVWTEAEGASPLGTLRQIWPALVGSLLALPLAIADMLRTSNRFVGPVLRLRNAMKCLVLGDWIEPLRPRQGDFWADLMERFNQLQQQLSERAER
jgi:hypothetical protein